MFVDKQWDELKAMAGGELLGENPRTVKAKKPVTFSLSTYNVVSGNQVNIQVKDKVLPLYFFPFSISSFPFFVCNASHPQLTGKPVAIASHTPFKFNSPKKDIWDVTFTPLVEGNVSLEMHINGKPVKGPSLFFSVLSSFLTCQPPL